MTAWLPLSPYAKTTGNDVNTKLLLHCDGADASTTFTDSSGVAHTVTANGNAQIDTAQSKFGGASALFDGTGDYLSIPDHTTLEFGTGAFTIDFWMRPASVTGTQTLATKRASSGDFGAFLILLSGTGGLLYMSANGAAWNIANGVSFGAGFAINTWYHIAIVRAGNDFYTFRDGVQVSTFSNASTLVDEADSLFIGSDSDSQGYSGHIDEFRISKGIARWTANFTPPASAYS